MALNAAPSSISGRQALLTLSPRRRRVFERTTARHIRCRTKPTISLYRRSIFLQRSPAMRFSKARASLQAIPSTEYTNGQKVRRRAKQASLYFFFFSFAAFSSTFSDDYPKCALASVSVIRTSRMHVLPLSHSPWMATSPRASSPSESASSLTSSALSVADTSLP
jgi:hypothetical protein